MSGVRLSDKRAYACHMYVRRSGFGHACKAAATRSFAGFLSDRTLSPAHGVPLPAHCSERWKEIDLVGLVKTFLGVNILGRV